MGLSLVAVTNVSIHVRGAAVQWYILLCGPVHAQVTMPRYPLQLQTRPQTPIPVTARSSKGNENVLHTFMFRVHFINYGLRRIDELIVRQCEIPLRLCIRAWAFVAGLWVVFRDQTGA